MKRVEAMNYSDLYERIGQPLQLNDHSIAVFKLSNGEVKAIENKSPHPKGGVLSEGLVSGEYVYCPVYDWKISLLDGKVQAPDKGEVKTYEVEIEGEKVYLLIPN